MDMKTWMFRGMTLLWGVVANRNEMGSIVQAESDWNKLLRTTFWLIVIVIVLVFPIMLMVSTELRCKTLVKEVWASRERPSTHIDNVAFLKISFIYYVWLWINLGSLGRENWSQDLWINPSNLTLGPNEYYYQKTHVVIYWCKPSLVWHFDVD